MAIVFVMSLFVGRLLQLQGIDSSAYAAQAEKQRTHTETLVAHRGDITDRDGAVLATTVDARAVYADPTLAQQATKTDPEAMAAKLAPLLGVDEKQIADRLRQKGKRFVYLAKQVTPKAGKQIMALGLPGVGLEPTSQRVYANGDVGADVIGFVGGDGNGMSGLEMALNSVLAGTNGSSSVEVSRGDRRAIPDGVRKAQPAVPGSDVRLTIDRDIQFHAQQAIAAQVAATGSSSGSVVVMDTRTAQILALAVAPTFDPNDVGASRPADRGNRALSDVFEPGSTNKVITMAAAIDSGLMTPTTPVTVPPTLERAGHTFHDAEKHGVEHLTLAGVLAQSSNIGTIEVAEQVGNDRLYHYLTAFGLGSKTGLGFPGESAGILAPPQQWSGTQQYTIPFGQGVAVTALQVASVYQVIANGGVRVTPSLVEGITRPDGTFDAAPAPQSKRVVSAEAAQQVSDMLEAVTSDEGTAPEARIPGYRVAGKTGTAQRVDPSCGCYRGYTASFVGFAPAGDPHLVVLVVLQDPQGARHYGGQIAAPVFKDVMSFALETEKIPPTGTKPPEVQLFTR